MANDQEIDPVPSAHWSTRALQARFAIAVLVPMTVGALVASFLPWPEWRVIAFAWGGLLGGVVSWWWLSASVAGRLRTLASALESGQAEALTTSRGDLGGLSDAAIALLKRQKNLERDLEELFELRGAVARLSAAAAVWAETERAPAHATTPTARGAAGSKRWLPCSSPALRRLGSHFWASSSECAPRP